MEYNDDEKKSILGYYLNHYNLNYEKGLLDAAVKKVAPVPREIHNFVIKLRDFIVSNKIEELSAKELDNFLKHAQIDDGGMMPIHKKYLEVLSQYDRAI
jgi:Holliday junction resolvasome RuvABC ATP-dependent DNA helicase subunit